MKIAWPLLGTSREDMLSGADEVLLNSFKELNTHDQAEILEILRIKKWLSSNVKP